MKKIQLISLVVLVISIIGFLLWRFVFTLPDWFIRVDGAIMLISIFLTSYSTTRIAMAKNKIK